MPLLTPADIDELARLAAEIARGAPMGDAWVAEYEALIERAMEDAAREWRRRRMFVDRRSGR